MARKLMALVLGLAMLLSLACSASAESDLHIADDVTLRFWFDLDLAANVPGMTDYNDSDAYKWLEEQTGIHIEWIHPATGTGRESFNAEVSGLFGPDRKNASTSSMKAET